MSRTFIAAVAILLGGCAIGSAQFLPTEEVARQPNRPPAARYELADSAGEKVGEAWVWSRGIFREEGHAVAHVGIELESSSMEGLSLDVASLRLIARTGEKDQGTPSSPARTSGTSSVDARGYSRLDVYFRLAEGVMPKSVYSFDVHWRATAGTAETGEVTPFVQSGKRRSSAIYHGAVIPGTNIFSPQGSWYSCPGEDEYYPTPPDCENDY